MAVNFAELPELLCKSRQPRYIRRYSVCRATLAAYCWQ